MVNMKQDTEFLCECGFHWREKPEFDVEQRFKARGTIGLFANAITTCPNCGYEGLARGIVPKGFSPLKFFLKREFSLYFPRGGCRPPSESEFHKMDTEEFSIFTLNSANIEKPPLKVHLYGEPSSKTLVLREIANYLRDKFGNISVDLRGPFTEIFLSQIDDLAKRLAKARIQDFSDPNAYFEPDSTEVETERKWLRNPNRNTRIIYDGYNLQTVFRGLLKKEESDLKHIHLIFTHRLFGTWDKEDERYHARVSIYGFPNLISTTGIVEAPAKPREFYRLKRKGIEGRELKQKFRGRFVDHSDERLTEIMRGYVMQAILYHLTLEPFCPDQRCRLFNSHWQEELIRAQLDDPEFCCYHEKILKKWKEKFSS